jgi:hypothetical protein
MQLTAVESFALQMLFRGPDTVISAVRMQLGMLEVVARRATGAAFLPPYIRYIRA